MSRFDGLSPNERAEQLRREREAEVKKSRRPTYSKFIDAIDRKLKALGR
jgi:hypothetical protein